MRCIPNRQKSDGTRRFLNLIQWAEQHRTPSLLVSLDAEKAFYRVHWKYLEETLIKFSFNGTFLNTISGLYSAPSSRVWTSGLLSESFPITNGPFIFALVIEPLAEVIRSNLLISGIPIGDTIHKIGLYADDIIISLTTCSPQLLDTFGAILLYIN